MTDDSQPLGSRRGRLAARLLGAGSWVACRLPERGAIWLAELAGDVWYRTAADKRRLARANLGRVVAWMAAEQAGDPSAWPAATDPVQLDRLVRSAFRHYARNYLETMRAPMMGGRYVERADSDRESGGRRCSLRGGRSDDLRRASLRVARDARRSTWSSGPAGR